MNRFNRSEKPHWVPPRSAEHLNRVCALVPDLHDSLQTDKVCVYWNMALLLGAAKDCNIQQH
ncbi:MAG: hypothetical protein CVU24_00655 [Betaproteobacteria bacterium HGW-Betaproteobacteria-18]|nr:MAG: hypothetical protein CVU24_00655 [Betaproteobacteria bacterium HGW-Betaproteobacteria-18]